MKPQFLIGACLLAASLAAAFLIASQRREIASLQLEQQHLRQTEARHLPSPAPAATARQPPPAEVLRLRRAITRLMGEASDLNAVRAENERLRARLASGPGSPDEFQLPEGYVLSSQAQWKGLNTPDNTLESFLWALRSGNVEQLFQVLTPKSAEAFEKQLGQSEESLREFQKMAQILPGARIAGTAAIRDDGGVELWMELVPGTTEDEPWRFLKINGEYRLEIQ